MLMSIKIKETKSQVVGGYPLKELVSKVTVSKKTPSMFRMLGNYKLPAKLIVKK
jgi:hypothetical protein